MLKNGGLSVRRTNKPYSRVGVDMALEQTINAEVGVGTIFRRYWLDVMCTTNQTGCKYKVNKLTFYMLKMEKKLALNGPAAEGYYHQFEIMLGRGVLEEIPQQELDEY